MGSLLEKSIELVKILKKRKISITYVQKTKCVRTKGKDMDWSKLWYSGEMRSRNRVGILVDNDLK